MQHTNQIMLLTIHILLIFLSNLFSIIHCNCIVNVENTEDYKPCVFPFTLSYKDKRGNQVTQDFYSCTDVIDTNKKQWCSTKVIFYENSSVYNLVYATQ